MGSVREPLYEIVRSRDGPRVSIELDDSLVVGSSFLVIGQAILAAIGSAFGLIGGRHVVRVGVSEGASLTVSRHGYKLRDTALAVARLLSTEVQETGLSVIEDWNQDPKHWLDRIESSPVTESSVELNDGTRSEDP